MSNELAPPAYAALLDSARRKLLSRVGSSSGSAFEAAAEVLREEHALRAQLVQQRQALLGA